MKILLASLMCMVLGTAQSFALKGGPNFGSGSVSTTGTYAGVLYPVESVNSIGLFSVTVPRTGLGSGTVFLFANSSAYNGTMQATADPDSAAFTGFIDAGFPFFDVVQTGSDAMGNPTFTTLTVRAVATGRVDGMVKANTNFLSRSNARLTGSALLEFNPDFFSGGSTSYELVGFKQTDI